MRRTIAFIPILLMLLCGCAHVISEQSRNLADKDLSFDALQAAPDGSVGKYILLGGLVAGARNSPEGGQLEVIQTPLAGNGLPEGVSRSQGRFLAESAGFLDAAKYSPGRPVTLLGQVKGKKTRQLDGFDYTYPVVTIREIHAWEYADGKGYPPLPAGSDAWGDPYYHGYGVIPPVWFQQPTGPVLKRWP
jgi:outer membrane lipoprotein